MRIRSIKPEWLEDERLSECSSDARVVSVALLLLADDVGRGRLGRATAARVFPANPSTFLAALSELTPWYVKTYIVRGQSYFEVPNWSKHQKIDRPSRPVTPEPSEGVLEYSADTREPSSSPRRGLDADLDQEKDRDQDLDREFRRVRAHTREEQSACRIGNDFMLAINASLTWDYGSWKRELELIGDKPAEQRAAALETIRGSRWCQTNAHTVNPGHVVKYWPKYASGKEAITQVVPKRASGMAPVSSAEEFEADRAGGIPPWEM